MLKLMYTLQNYTCAIIKDPLQSSSNITSTKVINTGYYALFRNYSPPTIGMTFSGPVLVSEGDEILLGWR